MSARKITRKKLGNLTHTARRVVSAPRFSRVQRNLTIQVPPDCDASIILKLVSHGDHREYAWWLLVGRSGEDAMTASYKFTGEDTLRCDIPTGTTISPKALQPHLARFLRSEGTQQDEPPVVK